jgi:hypothetical protein
MSLDELLGSLMTHQIMLKGREEEAKLKRSLALKPSLIKKVKKKRRVMMIKKRRFSQSDLKSL